jgi:hypothetical protein
VGRRQWKYVATHVATLYVDILFNFTLVEVIVEIVLDIVYTRIGRGQLSFKPDGRLQTLPL